MQSGPTHFILIHFIFFFTLDITSLLLRRVFFLPENTELLQCIGNVLKRFGLIFSARSCVSPWWI